MTDLEVNKTFWRVVSKRFSQASIDELKVVALAVWYQDDYSPDFSGLQGTEALKAGYLVDRLRRYRCVPKARKQRLKQLVSPLRSQVPSTSTRDLSSTPHRVESLAKEWGLEEDVSSLMPGLLEYQTRHYNHVM